MGRKKRPQADHRADLRGSGFIGLPTVVYKSEAFRSLSLLERAVLIELIAAFNGYNNGKIVLSQRQIAQSIGNSNYGKIGRAIATLMGRGLVDISADSVWKERRAREYRLTFISSGSPPFVQQATNEYRHWRKNDADGASAEGVKSAARVLAGGISSAETLSAGAVQIPQKSVHD